MKIQIVTLITCAMLSIVMAPAPAAVGIQADHAHSGSTAKFPHKPIRWVTGGGPDAMARILGQKFTEAWGQQIVVEERGGGGGMMSAELVVPTDVPVTFFVLLRLRVNFSLPSSCSAVTCFMVSVLVTLSTTFIMVVIGAISSLNLPSARLLAARCWLSTP